MLADDGSAMRGTFIIDPQGVVRHMSINDHDVGRNVSEILRLLRGFQSGEMCPAHWQPGQQAHAAYNQWLGKVFPRLRKRVLAEATKDLKTVLFEQGDIIIHQGARPNRFLSSRKARSASSGGSTMVARSSWRVSDAATYLAKWEFSPGIRERPTSGPTPT